MAWSVGAAMGAEMGLGRLLAAVLALAAAASVPASAGHEVDWLIPGVGRASLLKIATGRETLLTGSPEGVVAAWVLDTGLLLWRSIGAAGVRGILDAPGFVLSWDEANALRVVSMSTGELQWTAELQSVKDVVVTEEHVWTLEERGGITVRDLRSGKIAHTTDLETGSMLERHNEPLEHWQAIQGQSMTLALKNDIEVFAILGTNSGAIYSLTQHPDNCNHYSTNKIVPPVIPALVDSFTCSPGFAHEFGSRVAAVACQHLADEASVTLANTAGGAIWQNSAGNQVLFTQSSAQPFPLEGNGWVSTDSGSAVRSSRADNNAILFEIEWGVAGAKTSFLYTFTSTIASSDILTAVTNGEQELVVVTTSWDIMVFDISSCSTQLANSANMVWHRATALGAIREAIIAGPANQTEEQVHSSPRARLRNNLRLILDFILSGFSDPESKLITHDSHEDRVLVVLVESDLVYGLSTAARGRILWLKQLPPGGHARLYNLDSESICLVSDTAVQVLDVKDGTTKSESKRQSREEGVSTPSGALPIASTGQVLVYDEWASSEKKDVQSLTWVSGVQGASKISGSALTQDGTLDTQSWELNFPDSQVLELIAAHENNGPQFRSPVRVLPNREILHKYENPNAIAVIAKSTGESATVGLGFYLLDATTGDVIDYVFHQNGSCPVQAILSENWVAYSFWRSDELNSEIHVAEVYGERPPPGWLLGGIVSNARELVGLTTHRPEWKRSHKVDSVLRSSFALDEPVIALAVTTTVFGITAKAALVGFSSGRLVAISRVILDPRRSRGGGQDAGSFEKSPVYYPFISTEARTQDLVVDGSIPGLRGIKTALVSDRESGSHVVAFGADLFYTIYHSAGKFDTLSNDFNAAGLILTLVALLIAVSSAGLLVAQRRINQSF